MNEFCTVEKLPIDVEEAIRHRVSVRSYVPGGISADEREKVLAFAKTLTNPFGVAVRVRHLSRETGTEGQRLGTYGTIKGANDFLAITVKDVPFAMEAVGYQFENLVLYAASLGLGTVWLAATFSRKDFESAMDIAEDDLFPCIAPFGKPAQKTLLIGGFTRTALGSSKRKAWEKLFFEGGFDTPLTKEGAGAYERPLEMVRLAPSSTNGQPWRVVKEGDRFHFFVAYKPDLEKGPARIKHVDLEIALSHFDQEAKALGLPGAFAIAEPSFDVPTDMHYVLTYLAK